MNNYRYYKRTWIFLEESKEKLLSKEEAKSVLKEKGLMIRNTYDFDTDEETSFWFVIKDKIEDIAELPFSARRNIRISQRKYYFDTIDRDDFVKIAYPVFVENQKSFGNKIMSEADFRQMVEQYKTESEIECWIVSSRENDSVVAFSINRIKGNCCEYDFMACKPDALRDRTHPYYGLIYEMNNHYLSEKKLKYVSDGSRSITEHSNIQPFLEHNFKFRKAYCKLKIYYKWWFGVVIKVLFPFRNVIFFRSIRAILRMEEYSRKSK